MEDNNFCGAFIENTNSYCKRSAGWGCETPGVGHCHLHGGTPLYNSKLKYLDAMIAECKTSYEGFSKESAQDIKCLDAEIALLRSKVVDLEKNNNRAGKNNREILITIDTIRRLVDTKQKVEEGVKKNLSLEGVGELVDKIISIIDTRVRDEELKKLIACDLKGIVKV